MAFITKSADPRQGTANELESPALGTTGLGWNTS
jgi:glycyl-tRNA synthetase alpha subunit